MKTYTQAEADAVAAIMDAVVEFENAALFADKLAALGVTDPQANALWIDTGRRFLDLRGNVGSAQLRDDVIDAAVVAEKAWEVLTAEFDDLNMDVSWDFDFCRWVAVAYLLDLLNGDALTDHLRAKVLAEKDDLAARIEAQNAREAAEKALALARDAVTQAEAILAATKTAEA